MSKGRIRSNYQRRVLNWLLDGGGTVSDIALALALQMPHASLALRQLRERDDVLREDQTGIRGALHFITEQGRLRLELDALARLKDAPLNAPSRADGILLGHDGQHVLLGYVKPLLSELIYLPQQGVQTTRASGNDSNGNRGGSWAVVRTDSTRWYDLATLKPTAAPPTMDLGTLTEWSTRSPSICVVHAKLIDATAQWSMAPGSWFETGKNLEATDLALSYGKHTLGHTIGNKVTIRPPMSTHGHLSSKVGRKMALEALSDQALVFEHIRQSSGERTLPLEALWYWLRKKHPRLANDKLENKFQDLCRYLIGKGSTPPSIAIQRALLSDFGKANWTLGEVLSNINFSGTTSEGASALIEWYLADTDRECVVEWEHQVEANRTLLEELLASQRCRLLVTSSGEPQKLAHSAASLRTAGELGVVALYLGRGKTFSVKLQESNRESRTAAVHERIPTTAAEMLKAKSEEAYEHETFTTTSSSLEQRATIWHALSLYPRGDERWANQVETSFPLASWIGTPESERSSRWIRLRNVLPIGWADLLPIDACESSTLIRAMPVASLSWANRALDKVRQRFTHNIQSVLNYEAYLEEEQLKPWMSAAVLLTSQHLPDEFQPMIERSCELWLQEPHAVTQVLEALFPQGSPLNDRNQVCMQMCLNEASNQPRSSMLHVWGAAVGMIEHNEPMPPDSLRTLMGTLPTAWWSVWAGDWLLIQLSSSSGRRWLRDQDIAWPALIARPPGERSGLPGLPIQHPEGMLALEDVLQIHLVEDGVGKPSLLDVHDMLATVRRQEPVHYGRTHPLVGWLARPVEAWPRIGLEALRQGNEEVGALLYARSFAHRLE